MKAINVGDNTYDIFDNTMQVYDKLPAQPYVVRFSKNRGFFLEQFNDLEIKESKIYGVHESKVVKVLNMFESQNRNLGVILSGDKGIGKSLFAKLLSNAAIQKGMPLIIVDTYIPGISSYLESIEQEVMVLFDEFDKTFGEVKNENGNAAPQTELLTLFDGISTGKKLFVITCNELSKLNDYFINRPGRFHYHFRFDYPSPEEIREYLTDKLEEQYYKEIDSVISFAGKIQLNYDCLRAIVTELNTGLTFSEAIVDLNIININSTYYDVFVRYRNGLVLKEACTYIDFFSNEDVSVSLAYNDDFYVTKMIFNPRNVVYDKMANVNTIKPNCVRFQDYDFDEGYEKEKHMYEEAVKSGIDMIYMIRQQDKKLHYNVSMR